MDQLGRRTVLLVESVRAGRGRLAATMVSGIDVLTGAKRWTSPELLGELRDISIIEDGGRTHWAIATTAGMYVTR